MANPFDFDLRQDYADGPYTPARRPSFLAPIAAAVGFGVQVALLLLAYSHIRGTGNGLFQDTPVFLFAGLPYLVMAMIGLMVSGDRDVQASLIPVIVLLALAGAWGTTHIHPPRRGDFGGAIGLILAYLLQWLIVGLGLFVGFAVLAGKRR